MKLKTLTVSEVNNYLKRMIDNDFILNNLSVKGEISNLKVHSSGHIYFSLKDDEAKINCVMFKSDAVNLDFSLENGMKVNIKARLSVYLKEGSYQLYCREISKVGIGELFEQFNKMKKELENEGIFDSIYKKTIVRYPSSIGIITSPTGAAVRDIIDVIKRRNEKVNIIIYPAKVQGIGAEKTLIDGIKYFNRKNSVDTIIIGRGGGSIEELWAFNDKNLALEIFKSRIPVISAVGHETDFTICDFSSDKRAATPSVAGEISVREFTSIIDDLEKIKLTLKKDIVALLDNEKMKLNQISKVLNSKNPVNFLMFKREELKKNEIILKKSILKRLEIEKNKLILSKKVLDSVNPLNVLDRGFAIVTDTKNNNVLKRIDEISKISEIGIRLSDGEVKGSFEVID